MKILLTLSLAFSLLCEASVAQTFQKTMGGSELEYAQQIIAIAGDGYVISGASEGGLTLIRMDSEGDTLWTRRFLASENLSGAWVKQTQDNGFIMVGHEDFIGSENQRIFVIRLDADGNMVWSKMFGSILGDDISCVGVTLAPDGFYLAGSASTNSDDCLIIKLNSEGELDWSHMFGGEGHEGLADLVTTPDGGCMTVGFTGSFDGGLNSVFITRWSSDGELEWTGTLNNGLDCYGNGINATSNGYIISGACSAPSGLGETYDAMLIKLNMSLGITWAKIYAGSNFDMMISAIGLPSGGFAGVGYKSTSGNDANTFLLETDAFGELMWCKTYGENEFNFSTGLVQTANGFLIAGGMEDQDYRRDIYLIRTDQSGISNCNDGVFEPSVSEAELKVSEPLIVWEDILFMQEPTLTVEHGIAVNVICEFVQVDEQPVSMLHVFPNPFQNSFVISGTSRDGKIIIYDIAGKQVLAMSAQEENTTIDAGDLEMGIYKLNYIEDTRNSQSQIIHLPGQ